MRRRHEQLHRLFLVANTPPPRRRRRTTTNATATTTRTMRIRINQAITPITRDPTAGQQPMPTGGPRTMNRDGTAMTRDGTAGSAPCLMNGESRSSRTRAHSEPRARREADRAWIVGVQGNEPASHRTFAGKHVETAPGRWSVHPWVVGSGAGRCWWFDPARAPDGALGSEPSVAVGAHLDVLAVAVDRWVVVVGEHVDGVDIVERKRAEVDRVGLGAKFVDDGQHGSTWCLPDERVDRSFARVEVVAGAAAQLGAFAENEQRSLEPGEQPRGSRC